MDMGGRATPKSLMVWKAVTQITASRGKDAQRFQHNHWPFSQAPHKNGGKLIRAVSAAHYFLLLKDNIKLILVFPICSAWLPLLSMEKSHSFPLVLLCRCPLNNNFLTWCPINLSTLNQHEGTAKSQVQGTFFTTMMYFHSPFCRVHC